MSRKVRYPHEVKFCISAEDWQWLNEEAGRRNEYVATVLREAVKLAREQKTR